MQHAREGDGLAHVLQAADPGYGSLDTHTKAGVRDAAVLAEIKIPLECFFGEVVFLDAPHEEIVRGRALRSADDFALAFGGEDIDAQSEFVPLWVRFHVKRFHAGRVAMDHDGPVVER